VGKEVAETMTYAANVKAILDELVLRLKEIADFGNRVYKGYRAKIDKYPTILVHLREDRPQWINIKQARHRLTFNVSVKDTKNIKANAEVEMDNYIDLVGKVEDKLLSYVSNPPKWELLTPLTTNFSFGERGSFILYTALIQVEVVKTW